MWNMSDLKPPPNLMYDVRSNLIDADKLSSICNNAIGTLSNLNKLHLEATILSRILYRTKRKMRYDKGVMYMAKVNHCLLQYLSLDLLSAYKTIKPSDEDELGQVCAPSRQMLEWVLVRTQGFAQLFSYILKACRNAAYYVMCRIRLGHIWDLALLYLGAASRIWTISKFLVLKSFTWYELLKPYIDILKPIGLPWLPSNYEFPDDLKAWVKFVSIESIRPKKEATRHRIFALLDNADDEVVDVQNESIAVLSSSVTNDFAKEDQESDSEIGIKYTDSTNNMSQYQERNFISNPEDTGEPLSEAELSSLLPLKQDMKGKQSDHHQKKTKHTKKNQAFEGNIKAIGTSTLLHPSLPSTKEESKTKHERKQEHNKDNKEYKTSNKSFECSRDLTFQELNSTDELTTKQKTPCKRKRSDKTGQERVKGWQVKKMKKENICENVVQDSHIKQVKAIKSVSDLKKFLKNENSMRKQSNSVCLTNSLDKMQWNMFKNSMKRYINELSKDNVPEGCLKYRKNLKRARKEMLLRIQ